MTKAQFERYTVIAAGNDGLTLRKQGGASGRFFLPYKDEAAGVDRAYLKEVVHENTVVNLVGMTAYEDGQVGAEWVVVEPDYLVSPSELAAVFEPNATVPANYVLRLLLPRVSTYYTLLGNTSGQFLDDVVFQDDKHEATYQESLRKVFARYPTDFYLTMRDHEAAKHFHEEARIQFANIKKLPALLSTKFPENRKDTVLLEPSLVCPMLGLAGRMDYLAGGGSLLIEQKSGKRDEFYGTYKEPHFVQMLLYKLMVEHTEKLSDECQPYLLYSRYSDGLMAGEADMTLLRQAMEVRNRIVSLQEQFARGKVREFFENLSADNFLQRNISNRLWEGYIRPRIAGLLAPFDLTGRPENKSVPDNAMPQTDDYHHSLSLAFFYRFWQFLAKEQWLSRMGGGAYSKGYANLWNLTAGERQEQGDMYRDLRITQLISHTDDDGVDSVVFSITAPQQNAASNFRSGDTVQFYPYDEADGEPDITRQMALRGRVIKLTPDKIEVGLNNVQRNLSVFGDKATNFALEHDKVESGYAALTAGLYSLLTAPPEIQSNFFLTNLRDSSPPQSKKTNLLSKSGTYGTFSSIVAKAMAANQLFLIIGPPGSGKTSRALRYVVEEALRQDSKSQLLLMAFTNRAVDELCAMLEKIIEDSPTLLSDYLRAGNRLSSSEQYHKRLMSHRMGTQCRTADDVGKLLKDTRIVVGTTSTLMQRLHILRDMHFTMACVDEASQMLEPYLLPFFTLGVIDKFVLVGDQKQLPAVVAQSAAESAVDDAVLNAVGITNCARSLFDRMLHTLLQLERTDMYAQIETQGRMHPDLYTFVNEQFYQGQLNPVPLEHQSRQLSELFSKEPDSVSSLMHSLATKRVLFLNCLPNDDDAVSEANSAEAQLVAECLEHLDMLYHANNHHLKAEDVGIIVPYRSQIAMVRTELARLRLDKFLTATIDTVERYQGSQRNIIIYSLTVRNEQQLDFITSSTYTEEKEKGNTYTVDRKMNVALTRAREQMILIGNAELLRRNALFAKLINYYAPDTPLSKIVGVQ